MVGTMATELVERPALGEWVVDDSYKVVIGEKYVPPAPAKGELRNPNFPAEVAPGEAWTGTIDGVNVGGTTGRFRFRIDTETTEEADIPPGGTYRLTVNGTGPAEFTIYLERYV